MAGEETGQRGEAVAQAATDERSAGTRRGVGHVQGDEASAGAEDAQHLGEGGREVHQVAQEEAADDGVEGGVGEGELEGVDHGPVRSGIIARAALVASGEEHRAGEVAGDDAPGAGAAEVAGHVPRAGAEVQDGAVARGGGGHGAGAPAAVQAGGHEAVHEVVTGDDGGEHRAHFGGALGWGEWSGRAGGGAQGRGRAGR